MKKEYTIPIYVECPNEAVFYNKEKQNEQMTKEKLKETIDMFLENLKDVDVHKEIAFFGGNFTGLEQEVQ